MNSTERKVEGNLAFESRKTYIRPQIESEEVFERTALACDGSPYLNSLYNTKEGYGSCGFADS